jgi:hypothetical protein
MFGNLADWRPTIRMVLLSMTWIFSSALLAAQDEVPQRIQQRPAHVST